MVCQIARDHSDLPSRKRFQKLRNYDNLPDDELGITYQQFVKEADHHQARGLRQREAGVLARGTLPLPDLLETIAGVRKGLACWDAVGIVGSGRGFRFAFSDRSRGVRISDSEPLRVPCGCGSISAALLPFEVRVFLCVPPLPGCSHFLPLQ